MKRIAFITVALVACLAGDAVAQQVAIYNDPNVPRLGAPVVIGDMLQTAMDGLGLDAEIIDRDGCADYIAANPEGILIIAQGIAPGSVFENAGEDDPLRDWLFDGGIAGFIGEYPFYYWDNTGNVAAAGGQAGLFGATITNGATDVVQPTELGLEYIPSLADFDDGYTTNRGGGIGNLTNNSFNYEAYMEGASVADPVAWQAPDMQGWFISMYTSCCGTALPTNEQIAQHMAELIANRFAVNLAVNPGGKTSLTWGELKDAR